MKSTFIYALKDPDTGQLRYVGKSNSPEKRIRDHLRDVGKNHRTSWLKSLCLGGLSPALIILDEVPEEYWQQLECAYIQFYRECGCDLVNETVGGDSGPSRSGKKDSDAVRKNKSEARKGMKFTPGHCENMRKARLGKKHSFEIVKKRISKKSKKTGSGFVGVNWQSDRGQYTVLLQIPGKRRIFLGRYKKIEDAVFVRALAVDKHYGAPL